MQAIVCRAYGPPSSLELAELPAPVPDAGQVLVRVRACAINFPDVLVIQGKYQFQPPMPFAPGTDVAGTVAAVGLGVTGVAVGDRVFGFTGAAMGGLAELALCDAALIGSIPDGVDFPVAAAFQMTYATAYHALQDRARVQQGETVLVLGAAGGTGLAAVELAKRLGARVIAAASSDGKLEVCRERGADATLNYATTTLRDGLKALAPGGVDVVFDPVGGELAEPALRSVAWNGRYLVVGFASGDIPRLPQNLPLLKGCAIVGVFLGGFMQHEPARSLANLRQLAAWLADGSLRPRVDRTYPLADAPRALEDLLARRVMGKAVVVG